VRWPAWATPITFARVIDALLTGHCGEPRQITGDELTAQSAARLFARPGEATPYAQAILRCGVPF